MTQRERNVSHVGATGGIRLGITQRLLVLRPGFVKTHHHRRLVSKLTTAGTTRPCATQRVVVS